MDNRNTILIVDDEPHICETLSSLFSSEGLQTRSAATGEQALVIIKQGGIDAVFIDLHLPDTNGVELLESIKEVDDTVICFIITGRASIHDSIKALKQGASDYFIKPLVAEQLFHSLRTALEKKEITLSLQASQQQLNQNLELQKVINLLLEMALSERELDEILNDALEAMLNIPWISPEGKGAIFLADSKKKNLKMKVQRGFSTEVAQMCKIVPFGQCVCGLAAQTGKIQFASCDGMCPEHPGPHAPHKHYCLPIMINNQTMGVINLNLQPSFNYNELENDALLAIANTIAGIIKRKTAEQEREEMKLRVEQAQRLEAIGTLAGGIAHDFNNILTAILGFADLAYNSIDHENQACEYIEQVITSGNRAKELIRQILTFSRSSDQQKQPLLIHLIVKEALKLIRASIPTDINIKQNIFTDTASVLANPGQIHQIIMNLCTNAYHAMEESGGTLTVTVKNISLPSPEITMPTILEDGDYVLLEVNDTGVGIDQAIIGRIFDPYFTTKDTGKGTGLGLSVIHGIVNDHCGEIIVSSIRDSGSNFQVLFPKSTTVLTKMEAAQSDLPTGREHILFVDDEEQIVALYQQILQKLGYTVDTRTSSIEALHAFEHNPGRYDLVITDNQMPNMRGDRLAIMLLKIRQDLPIIISSGFSELLESEKINKLGIKALIHKPISQKELAETVRKVLDGQIHNGIG